MVYSSPTVQQIKKVSQQSLSELPEETKRLKNPNKYPVYITEKLAKLQDELLNDQEY
nr:hypothetical protein [Oenococcus oeni]